MTAKCLWFTGLPCSGKTTLAKKLEPYFPKCQILDGDEIRATPLANFAGFSEEERKAHILRMGHIAKMFTEQGITSICSFVSPNKDVREQVRAMFKGNFIEIYLKTPLNTCVKRDVKGMYAKAKAGEIKNFTGLGGPYTPPSSPEISLDTSTLSIDDCVKRILTYHKPWSEPASLFIGRWNGVFHNGHDHIIDQELQAGNSVILAIRNVAPDEKNPWPASWVKKMLEHRYKENSRVKVIIIPDIQSVNYGRGVGYQVKEIKVVQTVAQISGTKIRKLIAQGDHSWKQLVPPEIYDYLLNFSS